jgi:phage shock protein E
MDWWPMALIVVLVGVLAYARRGGQISAARAAEHLRAGAALIDVRTPAEFEREHLPGAVNLPLAELARAAATRLPDTRAVVLLHCHGGGRSLVARGILRRQGYVEAHNLGSYGRARAILARARG